MAQLTIQAFKTKWAVRFADNTTGEIDEADMREFQDDIADSFGGTQDFSSLLYNAATEYNTTTNPFAEYAGRLFKSKIDNNIGNTPPSAPNISGDYENTYWVEVSKSEASPIKEWAAGVYGEGLIVVLQNNFFYRLANATRPFESTNFATELANGDWVIIGGGGTSFTSLGTFDPSSISMASSGSYDAYTTTGNVTLNLTGGVEGVAQIVEITFNGTHSIIVPSGIKNDSKAWNADKTTLGYTPAAGVYTMALTYVAGKYRFYLQLDSQTATIPQLSAPSLSTTVISATQIDVTVGTVANASSYVLEWSPNGTDTWTQLTTSSGTYNHTSLNASTQYFYRSRAIGDGVNYSTSVNATANATTNATSNQLATPANFAAVAADSATIDLSWSDVANESSYYLERSTDQTNWTQIGGTIAANTLSYQDTGLTPTTQYFYRLNAVGNNAPYTDSNKISANATTSAVLTPTLSLTPDDQQITATFGNIDPNADATEFERSLDGSTGWANVEEHTSHDTDGVIDASLTNNTQYFYRYRVQVNSVWSAYATATATPSQSIIAATSTNISSNNGTFTATAANARLTGTRKLTSANSGGYVRHQPRLLQNETAVLGLDTVNAEDAQSNFTHRIYTFSGNIYYKSGGGAGINSGVAYNSQTIVEIAWDGSTITYRYSNNNGTSWNTITTVAETATELFIVAEIINSGNVLSNTIVAGGIIV